MNPLLPLEHPLPDGVTCPACGSALKKLEGYREMLVLLREQFADPQLSGWECTVSSCRAFLVVSPFRVPTMIDRIEDLGERRSKK